MADRLQAIIKSRSIGRRLHGRGERLRRGSTEHISDGWDRRDRPGRSSAATQLAADVTDVRTQRVRVRAPAPPDVRVEATRGDDVTGVRDEHVKDAEFGRREADAGVVPGDFDRLRGETQPVELQGWLRFVVRSPLGAAQDGTNAGDQLPELERLREKVVGAEVEGTQPVER